MTTAGIYEAIRGTLGDGERLPKGYEPPQEHVAPNEIRFMAGARDGIGVFHESRRDPGDAVTEILGCLRAGDTDRIASVIADTGTLTIVDPLIDAIQSAGDLDVSAVRTYAESLAFRSSDQEQVKLGIALLGLLNLDDLPEDQDRLVRLGLCEEFTLYVVVAATRWKHGEYVVWHLAKNTDGWGKIHAVTRLTPTTFEISDWLLRHGCANTVMDAYLGLECAIKGDLIDALRRDDLDDDLFDGVCVIMDALSDEGPVAGFSAYEHTDEAIARFLHHAITKAHTLSQLSHILNVETAIPHLDLADKNDLLALCDRIKAVPHWVSLIESSVNTQDDDFFRAVSAADRLNVDVNAPVLDAIKADPVKNGWLASRLFHDRGTAEDIVSLYERTLPLAEIASGMGDYLFSPTHGAECDCLDTLLIALEDYPLLGEALVGTSLMSPVVRNRYLACGTLEAWVGQLSQPLKTFSPSLHETLSRVAAAEVDDTVKDRMAALLVVM